MANIGYKETLLVFSTNKKKVGLKTLRKYGGAELMYLGVLGHRDL